MFLIVRKRDGMRIIKPYAQILETLDGGAYYMRVIESAARISHGSESKQTTDTWKRFIETVVLGHGDWSVVEHVTFSVEFKVDRGVTHELVRHRLFSYTQSSTRFINYAKSKDGIFPNPAEFVYPFPEVQCEYCLDNKQALKFPDGWFHSPDKGPQVKCVYNRDWLNTIQTLEDTYKNLIGQGWSPQIARSIFPNALASTIRMTGNLRNWRHFFLMRTTVESHPQMREVTIPLLAQFKERIPLLFDDIEPGSRQIENLKKAR